MRFPRPRSLNGLILVGFGLVALPLLIAVLWALVNLDRVAEQSEQLVFTGMTAAENNRRIDEQLSSLERLARQYQVLKNPDSLQLMMQDLQGFEALLVEMAPKRAALSLCCLTVPPMMRHLTQRSADSRHCGSQLRTSAAS
jgi:two-component system sensor histidine kinase GlrK